MEDAIWHEKPADDYMLCLSIDVAAGGDNTTYTATYMETVVGEKVHSMYILEPRQDIISWMDMKEDIKELIRTMCPTYLRGPWSAFESLLLRHTSQPGGPVHCVAAQLAPGPLP